jgi:phosphoenolpyruvate carboxykinase (diphosphate)
MELQRSVGLRTDGTVAMLDRRTAIRAIALKLAALGHSVPESVGDQEVLDLARDLFARYREQTRLLSDHLCPADQRIQAFVDQQLAGLELQKPVRLPSSTFILDRYGLARELSLPIDADAWHNDLVSSYRLDNGVLHNPINDRRTTQGVFHVADTGLPVPADKLAVPLIAYANMLREALNPPATTNRLPFTASWDQPVETLVSLLLRPLVCPAVPKHSGEKRMEIRFIAPGGLVSNLDFVESIFENAGDPYLPENDAALDVDHWTGHTGCVILAPHLTRLRKKDLGLPHVSQASEAQRAVGMCWAKDDELYNNGSAFKITMRSIDGLMVTILADNYFGYCKKEVKTQISFSANLFGLAEEEHAGGALAFSTYSLGDRFLADARREMSQHRFSEVVELLGDAIEVHDSGYATDKQYSDIHYVPEDAEIDLKKQDLKWTSKDEEQHLKVLPGHHYILPSGYKVRMAKHPAAPSWRLLGTAPEGTFCHKPCTVSGGGKSEISKSLIDAVLYGPVYTGNFEEDMALVEQIFQKDFKDALLPELRQSGGRARPILSAERSLGSVIKLLTPSPEFTQEYNGWLAAIPNYVRALVFVIKRFHRADDGGSWRAHFSVDIINGAPGHELKHDGRKLVGSYLRVGFDPSGAWRTYKLRQDFVAADKVQMEDDISASVVVPASALLGLPHEYEGHPSLKLVQNCEWRLFQRPDDAIHPGFDKQTEDDMSREGLFCSNFQPLDASDARDMVEDVALHDAFTEPMRRHVEKNAGRLGDGNFICSAKPRLVGGKPSKNPRYLQVRPDVTRQRDKYIAYMGARLYRRLPIEEAVVFPVISVLSGRRNNPPDDGIRPLCVYGPIHYQELPELFMDYVCSLTGKSPSTTGAGSEGALTKGPFNALCATADLNNALVSMLLTGYAGFSSAAGYIGPDGRVDHDVSLLIPEIWCRMFPAERDPLRMIAEGQLEKLNDYEVDGKKVLASRLGYRITSKFVHTFFGRVFDNPVSVFSEAILKPETQSPAVFADGVCNIIEAHERVAQSYFEDNSIEDACPPLCALLHVMAYGHWQNKDASHPDFRRMFTREALLESDWYKERLRVKQTRDVELWQSHVQRLAEFLALPSHHEEARRLGVQDRLSRAKAELERVSSSRYLAELQGTIGADPIHRGIEASKLLRTSGGQQRFQALTN